MNERLETRPRAFLVAWLSATVVLAILVVGLNMCVDPFLVFGAPRIAGLNAVKPEAGSHTVLAKRYLLARAQASGVMFGDSKTDIGLDPESPAWPEDARPVFNDGLPGITLEAMLVEIRRVLSIKPVRRILVLLDMQTLLAPPLPVADAEAAPPQQAVLPFASARINDLVLSTLSIDALQDSVLTLASQRSAGVNDLSDQGSTSEAAFRREAEVDGETVMFAQKDAALTDRFRRLTEYLSQHPGIGLHRVDLVAEIIATCRAQHVALDLVIAPYHADYLEIVNRAGLWPRYEQAKTELGKLVAGAGAGVSLWDFLGYDAYSRNPISAAQWYWEPTHFRKSLGELILQTIYRSRPGWGTRISNPVQQQN